MKKTSTIWTRRLTAYWTMSIPVPLPLPEDALTF
jgi:hypothetical protein